jgi:hypothetical protein
MLTAQSRPSVAVTPVPCLPAAGRSPTTARHMARRTAFLPDATKGKQAEHDVWSRALCVAPSQHTYSPSPSVHARCPCHVALVSETLQSNAASFFGFPRRSLGNSGKEKVAEGIRGPLVGDENPVTSMSLTASSSVGWIISATRRAGGRLLHLLVLRHRRRTAWRLGKRTNRWLRACVGANVPAGIDTHVRTTPASLLLTERESYYYTAAPALLYALYNVRD